MRLLAVVCMAFLGSPVMSSDNSVLQAKKLADVDHTAVCNDGSTGVYFISSGRGKASHKWVIRFMGGGWCIDRHDCKNRWEAQPHLMSTKGLPEKLQPGQHVEGIPDIFLPLHGILSPSADENPHFADWRHVYLWYCSSDSHLGDAPSGSSEKTGPWHFKGKRIAAAMVQDLLENELLASAEEILMTGDSAGGVGVMNNADFVFSMIRERAKSLRRYKVLVDAGWFLDIPSFSKASWFTFQRAARSLQHNWNATYDRLSYALSRSDTRANYDTHGQAVLSILAKWRNPLEREATIHMSCEAHFGRSHSWRCFHAQYAWPHIEAPVLFLEYLYDSANLGFDAAQLEDFEPFRRKLTASFCSAPACAAAANAWQWLWCGTRALTGKSFSSLHGMLTSSERSPRLFAPACHLHESIDYSWFAKVQSEGAGFYQQLVDWFESGREVFFIDPHNGVRESCIHDSLSRQPPDKGAGHQGSTGTA